MVYSSIDFGNFLRFNDAMMTSFNIKFLTSSVELSASPGCEGTPLKETSLGGTSRELQAVGTCSQWVKTLKCAYSSSTLCE